jgi:hypothetical protein
LLWSGGGEALVISSQERQLQRAAASAERAIRAGSEFEPGEATTSEERQTYVELVHERVRLACQVNGEPQAGQSAALPACRCLQLSSRDARD